MMMMMINCLCKMIERWKTFSLFSGCRSCQRLSPLKISVTHWEAFRKVVNYFHKTLYLRCLTGFWICLCAKSVRIRSYSGPYFPALGLNTWRYIVSLRIQSECGKIRTRTTPSTDNFLRSASDICIFHRAALDYYPHILPLIKMTSISFSTNIRWVITKIPCKPKIIFRVKIPGVLF